MKMICIKGLKKAGLVAGQTYEVYPFEGNGHCAKVKPAVIVDGLLRRPRAVVCMHCKAKFPTSHWVFSASRFIPFDPDMTEDEANNLYKTDKEIA